MGYTEREAVLDTGSLLKKEAAKWKSYISKELAFLEIESWLSSVKLVEIFQNFKCQQVLNFSKRENIFL